MARTPEGATLTEQHRQIQLSVRAQALQDFTRIWPLWQTDDPASFSALITATLPLVRAYHRLSAAAAASYYQAFRSVEDIGGTATPRLAAAPVTAQVTASLYVTGQTATKNAVSAGQSPETARKTSLVRASGAVTRHVLAGGRDTIIGSVAADPEALGWARVTDADPCTFCLVLASRGPVYKAAASAGFEAHDHCSCGAEPFYTGSSWPGRAREFRGIYNTAIRDARANGELDRGTSNDELNAVRRYLAKQ